MADCSHIVRYKAGESPPVLTADQRRDGCAVLIDGAYMGWVCAGCLKDKLESLQATAVELSTKVGNLTACNGRLAARLEHLEAESERLARVGLHADPVRIRALELLADVAARG